MIIKYLKIDLVASEPHNVKFIFYEPPPYCPFFTFCHLKNN